MIGIVYHRLVQFRHTYSECLYLHLISIKIQLFYKSRLWMLKLFTLNIFNFETFWYLRLMASDHCLFANLHLRLISIKFQQFYGIHFLMLQNFIITMLNSSAI